MPAMIFISVDLPAPFSPISACTWPRLKRNETLSSARTPGKALRTFSTSSRYSAFGTAPLARTICAVVGLSISAALLLWSAPAFARYARRRLTDGPSRQDAEGVKRASAASGKRATSANPLGPQSAAPMRGRRSGGPRAAGSVLLGEVGPVGRPHQLELDIDFLVYALAGRELERGVDRALALTGGVLEHRDLEVARFHRGQGVLRRVDAADDRLFRIDARRLQRLQGADRHLVVIRDDRVVFHAFG